MFGDTLQHGANKLAAITGSKLDLDIDEKVRTMEVEYIIEGRDGLSIPKADVLQLLVGQFLNTSISSGNAIEGIVMKNYQLAAFANTNVEFYTVCTFPLCSFE